MAWWAWVLLGVVLLAAELVVATEFYLALVGIAAVAIGLLVGVGLGGAAWMQWVAFALLSAGFVVVFRRRLRSRLGDQGTSAPLEGEIATLRERIDPGRTGRAELRGSVWTARNVADVVLAEGERARVESVEGLVIHLRPETVASTGGAAPSEETPT